MESVGKTMSQMNRSQQFNYEELVAQILAEPDCNLYSKGRFIGCRNPS